MIGGAGSVFWLLVSGVFSVVIKYSENVITAKSSREKEGIAPVIASSFGSVGKPLALLYSFLCLLLSLVMGSAIQTKAAFELTNTAFNISPAFFLLFFSALLFLSIKEGGEKVEKITSYLIPLTTTIYILLCFSVIFLNSFKLFAVILSIIKSAFSVTSGIGGGISFLFSQALREGYLRGILSNEAGVGTSAFAHSRSIDRTPAVSGLYGMSEVFFDTFLLCPLSAFMILLSVDDPSSFDTPMSLVSSAVTASLGEWAVYPLIFCIFSFAFATVICWYYYGERCVIFLSEKSLSRLFLPAYLLFTLVGVIAPDRLLLNFTDLILFFMSLIVLSLLLIKRDLILGLTEDEKLI